MDNLPKIEPNTLVNNALNVAYLVVGIIAVLMLIYAGIAYSISAGDARKIEEAKKTIVYSIVGLIVVILASVITNFIVGSLK